MKWQNENRKVVAEAVLWSTQNTTILDTDEKILGSTVYDTPWDCILFLSIFSPSKLFASICCTKSCVDMFIECLCICQDFCQKDSSSRKEQAMSHKHCQVSWNWPFKGLFTLASSKASSRCGGGLLPLCHIQLIILSTSGRFSSGELLISEFLPQV